MLRAALALLALLSMAEGGQAAWHEASSAHFVVYSDENPETLKAYAEKLERFDKAMRFLRGVDDREVGRANRVRIFFVEDYGDIANLVGGGIAGFYVGRAGESFAVAPRETDRMSKMDERLNVLLHEYTHHFLFANWPNATLPWWFSEGNADFAGTARFKEDGSVLFGVPDAYRLRDLGLLLGRPLALPTMVAKDFDELRGDAAYALYARGWLLVHYMHFEKGRAGQLAKYLDAINAGESAANAAASAFGDLSLLERELEAYRKRKVLNQFSIAARALTIAPVTIRKLDDGEAALVPSRVRVALNDKRKADWVAANARRQAKPFPEHAGAQTVLAEAELKADNFDAAETAADAALKVDPKFGQAMVIKGMAMMARAVAAKSRDEAGWKAVRRWFTQANRLDPDDPRPLIQFYESFAKSGTVPTVNAVTGLKYAFALAPQDRELRLMLGRQLVADGDTKGALRVLKPVAYNPHGGDAGKAIRAILDLLERGDRAGALAKWESTKELKDPSDS